ELAPWVPELVEGPCPLGWGASTGSATQVLWGACFWVPELVEGPCPLGRGASTGSATQLGPLPLPAAAKRASTRRVTSGARMPSPAARARTAVISSSGPAFFSRNPPAPASSARKR